MSDQQQELDVAKTDAQWQEQLTPEAFQVLRKHGTERAGTSPLDKEYSKGTYRCAGCGTELFTSETKFNSGTGWPSFYQPVDGTIETSTDKSKFTAKNAAGISDTFSMTGRNLLVCATVSMAFPSSLRAKTSK
jgi:peptide-methionine (R)-S-oxide reductase